MKLNLKKIVKFTGAVGAAAGIVALSSVIASSAAVTAVKEGMKAAGDAMKKVLNEKKESDLYNDEALKAESITASVPGSEQEDVVIAQPDA